MDYRGIKHEQPKINLFYNYYDCGNAERQSELDECLNRALVFDRVITVHDRPTFKTLFEMSKNYPNDINVFTNSDVYFTDLSLLHLIKPNQCYAITRDDMINHKDAVGSQDAWVFRGVVKEVFADFYMGLYGCDNRIAYEIKSAGYEIINPALSINLVHLHKVDEKLIQGKVIRTKLNTVPPPYLTLPLCKL